MRPFTMSVIHIAPVIFPLCALSCAENRARPVTSASGTTSSDPTPAATTPDELVSQAVQSCQAVQASNIPVNCEVASIGATPAVMMEFPTVDTATAYLQPIASRVGIPFCLGTNGAQIHAGLVVAVEDQYRTYDCATQEWSGWQTLRDDSLDEVERDCQQVSDAKDVPVHCEMGTADDIPSLVLTFRTEDAVFQYKSAMTDRVVLPFCKAAKARNVTAQAIALSGTTAQVFHCPLGVWGARQAPPEPPRKAQVRF
jgi:hypothetical protein